MPAAKTKPSPTAIMSFSINDPVQQARLSAHRVKEIG
jgi:hypothetical protein